jgi:hypothetical protein
MNWTAPRLMCTMSLMTRLSILRSALVPRWNGGAGGQTALTRA